MGEADARVTQHHTLKSLGELIDGIRRYNSGGIIAVIDGQSLKHAIRRPTDSGYVDISLLLEDINVRYPSWYAIVVDRDPIASESSEWEWADNILHCGFMGSIFVARLNRSVVHVDGPRGERGILCFSRGNKEKASHQICRSDDLIMQFILTNLARRPDVNVIAVSDNNCYIPSSPPHSEWGAKEMDMIPPFKVEACVGDMYQGETGFNTFKLPFTEECVESSLGVIRGAAQSWRHMGAREFASQYQWHWPVHHPMASPSSFWGPGHLDALYAGGASTTGPGTPSSEVASSPAQPDSPIRKTNISKRAEVASMIAARQGTPLSTEKQELLDERRAAPWYIEYQERMHKTPEDFRIGYQGDRPYPNVDTFRDMLDRWQRRVVMANERARKQKELRENRITTQGTGG